VPPLNAETLRNQSLASPHAEGCWTALGDLYFFQRGRAGRAEKKPAPSSMILIGRVQLPDKHRSILSAERAKTPWGAAGALLRPEFFPVRRT